MQKSEINILVVEDDTTQREALAKAINSLGYRSIPVKKSDEAETIARVKPIHGAIVDCMLPGKSGVDLVTKIRENMHESAPVIFMSGIYRDKSFQQEAVKKVNAAGFFTKPFNLKELTDLLEKNLSAFVDAPKVDLHALLAAPMASHRDRRKALDHVEEMKGYDLPFVFCILLDSESSGYLNIVDEDQNIYGVTFAKGNIVKVDSESTVFMTRQTLIDHGFITEEELALVKEKQPLDLMDALIARGLMSPHVPAVVNGEQVIAEITKLVGPKSLKINFVVDRKIKPSDHSVSFTTFQGKLPELIDKYIPAEYLKSFYSIWNGHPIRLGPNYQTDVKLFEHPMLKKTVGLKEAFVAEKTIEESLAQPAFKEEEFLKSLHLLAIRRVVVFHETKRVLNVDEHVNRLKALHRDLKGKNVFQIFEFFGLGISPKAPEVSKFYKDFAKANHPDTLPQAISEEVRKLNHEVFSWISEAHSVLTDEKKRQEYEMGLRQQEGERQLRSEDLLSEGYQLLRKAQYAEAKTKIDEALKLYRSDKGYLYSLWAEVKCLQAPPELDVSDGWLAELKKMPVHSRRTALFYFTNGLIKKLRGQLEEAKNEFEKAVQTDSEFVDARRELVAVKGATPQKMSMNELLNADLGTVITRIFKKSS